MGDMRRQQNCEYNLKTLMITLPSVSDRKGKMYQRERTEVHKSGKSHALIGMKMTGQRECSIFNSKRSVKPDSSNCLTDARFGLLFPSAADNDCTAREGSFSSKYKTAKRFARLNPSFYFCLLLFSICAATDAQVFSPAYVSSLSGGVGSRFKNFIGVSDLKISVFSNKSEDEKVGTLVTAVHGKYSSDNTNKI